MDMLKIHSDLLANAGLMLMAQNGQALERVPARGRARLAGCGRRLLGRGPLSGPRGRPATASPGWSFSNRWFPAFVVFASHN